MVVPEKLVPSIEKLTQNLFICASTIAQYAALACFEPASLALYESRRSEFKRRRDYIVPAMRELGFKIPVTPDGAFYVYADCTALSNDADRLTLDLLNSANVVLVPGMDFGPSTAHTYIRLSYACSLENLQEAVGRMRQFFAQQA
jgi:aspartate/methionine/tyrosine aminotransferase